MEKLGLSQKEAIEKLKTYGANRLEYFKINILEIVKRNILNFFNLFLLTAGIFSLILEGTKIETILIFFFFFLALIVSIYQDYHSNKLAQKLLSYFKNYTWVKRDNEWKKILQEELVPGDYIKVSTGYKVPADIKITKNESTLVDESLITGESEPIYKKEGETAYMGTMVINGEFEGEVIATGKKSYFGSIAKKTLEIKKETAYQKILDDFARKIAYLSFFLSLLIILINFIKPEPIDFKAILIFAIVLAVAAVPEFLPVMTVLTLSLAGDKLAKKGLVIKRLSALEDLGIVQVIFTDKTGTITKNELKLERIITNIESDESLLEIHSGTSNGKENNRNVRFQKITQEQNSLNFNDKAQEKLIKFLKYFLSDYHFTKDITPYEKAFLEKYNIITNPNPDLSRPRLKQSVNLTRNKTEIFIDYSDLEFIEDVPFDPNLRIKKVILKDKNTGEIIEVIKGAPENVIKLCFLQKKDLSVAEKEWLNIFKKEDNEGFRTLALGLLKPEKNFLGIASFFDPLKKSAFPAFDLAKKLNLEIKILTGDSPNVAKKIALELGIITEEEKIFVGEEIRNLEEKELRKIIIQHKVFARLLPEDKLKIIKNLEKEKIIAFLGEGINDAPALKIAHSALVVDSASDITKEEADIILKEKDLKLIVDGIIEGRKAVENIGKYIKHTMSDNFGNIISISFLTSFLPFVPLTPIQVLLTNLLTDIPLSAFAKDNVEIKEIKRSVKISNQELIFLLLILGLIAGAINILGYFIVKNESPETIRTYIFYLTTVSGILVSLSIRTKDWFFASKPSFLFLIISILALFLSMGIVFIPEIGKIFGFTALNKKLILSSIFLLTIFISVTEISKKKFYRKFPDSI